MTTDKDDFKKLYDKLAGYWLMHVLRDTPVEKVHTSYFVDDGRKRDKVIRILSEEGYLTRNEEGIVFPTSKAYDNLVAEKPDFVRKNFGGSSSPTKREELERVPGVPWSELTLAERKWVAEHRAEYQFFHFDSNWSHRGKTVVDPTNIDAWLAYNKPIWISDATYDAELNKRLYEARFNYARGRNLAWGLEDQKLIENVDKDVFENLNDDAGFFARFTHHFGLDPTKWEEESHKLIEKCREEIAKLTRRANVLIETNQKIARRGGWEAFLKKYDERLHEELKDKEET